MGYNIQCRLDSCTEVLHTQQLKSTNIIGHFPTHYWAVSRQIYCTLSMGKPFKPLPTSNTYFELWWAANWIIKENLYCFIVDYSQLYLSFISRYLSINTSPDFKQYKVIIMFVRQQIKEVLHGNGFTSKMPSKALCYYHLQRKTLEFNSIRSNTKLMSVWLVCEHIRQILCYNCHVAIP